MSDSGLFERLTRRVDSLIPTRVTGRVSAITGTTIAAVGMPAPVGARCEARTGGGRRVECEVVGLKLGQTLLSVFDDATGLAPGDDIELLSASADAPVGFDLLGRVIDGQGHALDDGPDPVLNYSYPLYRDPPAPLERRSIDAPLGLGVRAIDGLLTAGLGQRLGVFAGTGVGKSVLMGMLCRNTQADVNVVALIGERGREVGDFIETQLGPEGLKRSVVVACTSDQAPALRVRSCFLATAIAEFFRDQGLNVLLMMDSLTRMAMAQRQIGLAAG
ncbi:MAG: EscN/YscN/HrcN family type III secretion system ATPase, partial [Phycisphaerales bacterium]|nr:EscN/YscN/HrcN family type III secretion system ATPase [Phycisphaerales bacterium]